MQEELEYKIENVEEKLRGIYPEKDAQRFANAFRIILDIQSNYCNTNTRLKEINKELEILREYLKDKKEFTNEIDNFLKRISFGFRGENESLSKEDVEELEHFCKKLTEKMNARFLDVPDVQRIKEIEGQLVGYVWGTDARSTLNAGKIFVESHLDEFVKRLR